MALPKLRQPAAASAHAASTWGPRSAWRPRRLHDQDPQNSAEGTGGVGRPVAPSAALGAEGENAVQQRGILQDLIEQAVLVAGDRKIAQIHVALGEVYGVSVSALQYYFDRVKSDTPAAGADLVIRVQPALIRCDDCGELLGRAIMQIGICPTCGSLDLRLISGNRLILEAVDVAH